MYIGTFVCQLDYLISLLKFQVQNSHYFAASKFCVEANGGVIINPALSNTMSKPDPD